MGSLGREDYPDIPLETAITYLAKASRVLSEGIDRDGFAQALDLKSGSGGFARVLSSLRRYGLIEGHGTFKTTDLATQIVHGFTQQDKDKARAQAWLKIDIIREIYQRYKTSVPDKGGEFLAFLSKLTGADPQEVRSKSDFLHGLIVDSMKDLKTLQDQVSVESGTQPSNSSTPSEQVTPTTNPGLLDARIGDVYIRVPSTMEGLETARTLVALLAFQIKSNDTPARQM